MYESIPLRSYSEEEVDFAAQYVKNNYPELWDAVRELDQRNGLNEELIGTLAGRVKETGMTTNLSDMTTLCMAVRRRIYDPFPHRPSTPSGR